MGSKSLRYHSSSEDQWNKPRKRIRRKRDDSLYRQRDRDRERDTYRDKERNRDRDRHTDRHRERDTDRHSDRHRERDIDRDEDRHRERNTDRHSDRHRELERDRSRYHSRNKPLPSKSPLHLCRRQDFTENSSDHRDHHRNQSDRSSSNSLEKGQSLSIRKSTSPIPSQSLSHEANFFGKTSLANRDKIIEKEKPNFAPTGLLAAASNSVLKADGSSILLKYQEPPESHKPPTKDEWRIFVFKDSETLETIELNRKSCWLVGRETSIVDIIAEHPSVSKQHAVIQFRYIKKKDEFGIRSGKVKPYVIDLDSANGTLLNKEAIPKSRFIELYDKDLLQFAHSSREYVLILSPKS